MEKMSLDELRTCLFNLPDGTITDLTRVEDLLAPCWDDLSGSESGGMAGYKLHGRMEDVEWTRPYLTFQIARHGATVLGSVYAGLQSWKVNIDEKVAIFWPHEGRRVVGTRNASVKVQPIAAEIADLITSGKEDSRLKWIAAGEVRVIIGEVIPDDCPPQTLTGRRRRFRTALQKELEPRGWECAPGKSWLFLKTGGTELSP
jgi:hypothetical protein